MKALFDKASYTCSKMVTNTYSTSFSLAVKMLAVDIQAPIYAIYGFVRFADEIVDSFHDYPKEELLNEFEVELTKALERRISLNPVLNAFQQVVHTYDIDHDLIDAFLDSMHTDIHRRQYESREQYESYIYGSANVVGLMCLKVFVNGDRKRYRELKPYAEKLGSAFQKVNFLRDFKDDTEVLQRSYFPYLNSDDLTPENKEMIITDIETDFQIAHIGIKKLPNEAKFGVYTAYIYYKQLLLKLKKANAGEIRNRRIRVSNSAKVGLLAKSFVNCKLNLL